MELAISDAIAAMLKAHEAKYSDSVIRAKPAPYLQE
jgi:hypothetical protein